MALARTVGYFFRRASAYGSLVSKASENVKTQSYCSPSKLNQCLSSLGARYFSVSSIKSGDLPSNMRFSQDHEWVLPDGAVATIGITDHAQVTLGDVVYIELPNVGDTLEPADVCGSVESVKAVAELFAPVSGEIVEVNTVLQDKSDLINSDPYGDGWMLKVKMSKPEEMEKLMTQEAYKELIEALE